MAALYWLLSGAIIYAAVTHYPKDVPPMQDITYCYEVTDDVAGMGLYYPCNDVAKERKA